MKADNGADAGLNSAKQRRVTRPQGAKPRRSKTDVPRNEQVLLDKASSVPVTAEGRAVFQRSRVRTVRKWATRILAPLAKLSVFVLSFVVQLLSETLFAPLLWVLGRLQRYPADIQFKRTTQRYLSVLSSTESYKTYLPTAQLLDAHLGIDRWKAQAPPRSLCNAEALLFDAQVALALAVSGNRIATASYLRGMLHRNAHGMTNPELYPYFTGTKACVEDYCAATCVLIGVFGGSRLPSDVDHMRVRSCFQLQAGESADASESAVDLTKLMREQVNAEATRRHLPAPVSLIAEGGEVDSVQNPQSSSPSVGPSREGPLSSHPISYTSCLSTSPSTADADVDIAAHVIQRGNCDSGHRRTEPARTDSATSQPATLLHRDKGSADKAEKVSEPSDDSHTSCYASFSSRSAVSGHERWGSDCPARSPGTSSFLQEMVSWARQHHNRGPKEDAAEGDVEGGPFAMSPCQRLNTLRDVLQSYGRTALILSGGASMGTYHTGVVRALYEAGVLPDIMSGSSAGSIIAAIICTKSPKDLKELIEVELLSTEILRLTPFGKDASLVQKVKRFFKTGFLMDVRSLMECIRGQCGDMTFLEAYKLSGRVLNITVTRDNQKGSQFDRHVLLNYLTAPHVVIWSAVSASSALPGLFTAVQLIEKEPDTGFFRPYLPGELYCDGSVAQDIPRDRLAQLFNVNYFIVSQVNPYVIPFLHPTSTVDTESRLRATASTRTAGLSTTRRASVVARLWYAWASFLRHVLLTCFHAGLLPKAGRFEVLFFLLRQGYCGNITILPIGDISSALPDYLNMASNPTAEYISYVATRAQVRTWPLSARIKTVTSIERALLREIAILEKTIQKSKKALS